MDKRKKLLSAVIALIVVCFCIGAVLVFNVIKEHNLKVIQAEALAELDAKNGEYDENYIVLYDTSKAEAQELAELYGAKLRITEDGKFARLELPEGTTIRDIYSQKDYRKYIEEMEADYAVSVSEIETLEEEDNYERYPLAPQYTVTDTDFSKQTYLNYLNMKNVWSNYTGKGITVAVIDSGIDTDHPEFAGRISEYSYNATEDKIVKDYTLEDGSYDWSLVEDEQGHGTAVTGVIAASMNSGSVVGIAPEVTIITIKAECDESGQFKRGSDLVFGLYYAIERDASVVNMSFGSDTNVFEEVLQLAYDSDIICVASAGNDSTSSLHYPAADINCIGVGALADGSWELAEYSNYGENTNIVAPGTTYTADIDGGYATSTGTSLSAPVVTGAIALLAQSDKYITVDKATELLYASAYDIGNAGPDLDFGYGAVDVYSLVLGTRGTVAFDMLADELDNIDQIFIKGNVLQKIPEPERNYAVFDGWYYDEQCTEEVIYYEDVFGDDLTLYAKWANEEDGVPYTYVILDDGTVEIRSYTGKRRFITVPEKIDGRIVSSIGDSAFANQTRLREIGLPSGLTNIGRYAFENCANLVTMEIPENVTTIGEGAFSGDVRLSTIAFLGNSKLSAIGDFAFESCGYLEKIELPASLESINGSAFYATTKLLSIKVQNGNDAFSDADGVLIDKSQSVIVAYPSAYATEYKLPDGIKEIGQYAFAFSKLTAIDLNNVQTIEDHAFGMSKLHSVAIPDSVTLIGKCAFISNESLSQVDIGLGVTTVPASCFGACSSLKELSIPSGVTAVDTKAFYLASLASVSFEDGSSLKTIGDSAFAGCCLREICFPDSLVSIGNSSFQGNPLSNIAFGENSSLKTIGEGAFSGCKLLNSIELPSRLESVSSFAFNDSGLSGTVVVPSSVTTLGKGVFASCSGLTAIDIEDGNAVYHDIDGVVYTLDNSTIHTYPAGKVLSTYYINEITKDIFAYSFCGAVSVNSVVVPEGVTVIGECGFYGCYASRYTLPSTLTDIGNNSFASNSKLSSITIPDNVIRIGRCAFAQDWNLRTITLNKTSCLSRIGFETFAYSGITSFTVPANVSTMAQYAFFGCYNLKTVTFAENSKLESLSAYVFEGCANITSLTFGSGSSLTSIQAHGLEGMAKIQTLDFSNTKLTNIDNFALRFCEMLSSVKLPDTVTNIGRYAFYGCESMTSLSVPAALEHIGSFAFLGTKDIEVYFASETLPLYIDEYWDHNIKGYYLGVTNVTTSGDFKYATLASGNVAILGYTGTATELDLTAYEFGGNITSIGGSAFEESTVESIVIPETVITIQAEAFAYSALKSITIPESVQFIGREAFINTSIETLDFSGTPTVRTIEQYAFENTKKLRSVTLPASLELMGTGAFSKSGLTEVVFAEGIRLSEIPQKAFNDTKLEAVTIPNSVSLINHNAFSGVKTLKRVDFGASESISIGSNAFYQTGLTSLHIPANVTNIGEFAFVGIKSLKEITVDEANPYYKSEDGLLLNKSGRKLINVPVGREGALSVPVSVEEIGFGAFEESKLSSVTFDKNANILTLGYRAFFKAENIKEITIPASVISIDYYAFAYCPALETVKFADSSRLKGIYEGAFCGDNKLKNITIPDSIVEISDFAFHGCSGITDIPVSKSSELKGIYDYSFAYTGIGGDYTFSEKLIDIGSYAFLGCDFTKITIPDTNAKQLVIGIGAFEECNKLREITLPFIGAGFEDEKLSWFGYIFGAGSYAANDVYIPDSLKNVKISEGISFVGEGGFYGITTIEEVSIPHSVQMVYYYAFSETSFVYELTNEISYVSAYLGSCFGTGIKGNLTLSEGIKCIYSNAFKGCANLVSVDLPSSITEIASEAFSNCSNLRKIDIPYGLTKISDNTFNGCSKLSSVIIPDSVTQIGTQAFSNCRNLKNITIPDSVTTIGSQAFYNCTGLQAITIPSSVTVIYGSAFYGCSNLLEVYNTIVHFHWLLVIRLMVMLHIMPRQ